MKRNVSGAGCCPVSSSRSSSTSSKRPSSSPSFSALLSASYTFPIDLTFQSGVTLLVCKYLKYSSGVEQQSQNWNCNCRQHEIAETTCEQLTGVSSALGDCQRFRNQCYNRRT